ncbi:MAG: AHH domain-containing protein [Paraglaciecola sp.]|uniref:AHH domain-containing protein n=1 Tax=Paraglaciecola sp. TaxID=1920173 RepID=UPI003298E471
MAQGHTKGVKKGKFCAQRTTSKAKCKCESPNNYVDNCDITGNFFLQGRKRKVKKKFEAHHLLCIASVTEFVGKDKKIQDIVKVTRWCINDSHNMLGMPLWGHTINHYCTFIGALFSKERDAPWFENTPMHDYDHNSTDGYKDELDDSLKELAKQIKALADKEHEMPEKKLADSLEAKSTSFRSKLLVRGKRSGGTHKAWQLGMEKPDSDWYLPFSMAKTRMVGKRRFAAKGFDDSGKMAEKMQKMMDAFKRWG